MMDPRTKGNLGVRLTWLAALAFVLCIFGQTLLLGVLLGMVLALEKNDWLSRQVLSAFLLSLVTALLNAVTSALGVLYAIPFLGTAMRGLFGVVFGIVELAVLVVAILAAIQAAKGGSPSIPVVTHLADAAFQYTERAYQPPYQQPYQQPAAPQQPYQAPGFDATQPPAYQAPAQPIYQAPAAPQAPDAPAPDAQTPTPQP